MTIYRSLWMIRVLLETEDWLPILRVVQPPSLMEKSSGVSITEDTKGSVVRSRYLVRF